MDKSNKFIESLYELKSIRKAAVDCDISVSELRVMFRNLDFVHDVVEVLQTLKYEVLFELINKATNEQDVKAMQIFLKHEFDGVKSEKEKIIVNVLKDLFNE